MTKLTKETEDVVARLREEARQEEAASKMLADAKTARQTDREDAWTDVGYAWITADLTTRWKAADLIQSLSDRIDVLEGALKPFAAIGDNFTNAGGWSDTDKIELMDAFRVLDKVPVAAFRQAKASLIKEGGR